MLQCRLVRRGARDQHEVAGALLDAYDLIRLVEMEGVADEGLEALVAQIQANVKARRYRLSNHAEREREADRITLQEIEDALLSHQCVAIEDYPDDPRGHSCLLLGFTAKNLPLHCVCGMAEEMRIIIALYRPDPSQWIDYKIRKERG
jgi:hypothetical protein